MANKNTKAETPVEEAPVLEDAQGEAKEVVSREQYDALLKQAQDLAAEANRRLALLEDDKKLLQETLRVQNKLVERFLAEEKK